MTPDDYDHMVSSINRCFDVLDDEIPSTIKKLQRLVREMTDTIAIQQHEINTLKAELAKASSEVSP